MMFAGLTRSAFTAHVTVFVFSLLSGTKSLHLISKNMNLNKVANSLAFFVKARYVFTLSRI